MPKRPHSPAPPCRDPYQDDPALVLCAPAFEPVALELAVPHALDATIRFEEEDHLYFVQYTRGGPFLTKDDGIESTSGLIHACFPHFDAPSVITKMRRGRKFKTSRYSAMTDKEILFLWSENGRKASTRGTLLHFLLECHNNGFTLAGSDYETLPDVQAYFRWRQVHFQGLLPFRTEMRMRTGLDLRLTGTADLLAIAEDHPPPEDCGGVLSLHLIDWKFSKEIKRENRFEKGRGPCAHMDNCNYYHYMLQQNIYQWMLETYYPQWEWKDQTYTSVRIVSKHLAIFHENHGPEGLFLPLPDCRETVEAMMQERRTQIETRFGPGKAYCPVTDLVPLFRMETRPPPPPPLTDVQSSPLVQEAPSSPLVVPLP